MTLETLIAKAQNARESAYAPYSGYAVGAAVEGAGGGAWMGCNVENSSYPAGICAERNAIVQMVAAGERELRRVVVVTQDGGTPCGICLQTMFEFAPNPNFVEVVAATPEGVMGKWTLAELMPLGFRL